MNKKIFAIIIGVGILLRLILSITTYHSDLGAFALAGKYIVGEGKWLSFYDTIASKDAQGVLVVHRDDMVFNYQPLAYLIPSVFYLPFSGIVKQTGDLLINRQWVNAQSSPVNFTLLLYKLPMLAADLAILFLIAKFFQKRRDRRLAQLLWIANPIAIYVSSIMGQVDIIIAFFILAALFLYKIKKPTQSAILIAISALIKPIGLILIPLLALHYYRKTRKIFPSLLLIVSGATTYLLGILPYINSASYRYYALFAEQINKSIYASISIASGHDIPLFFIAYALIAVLLWRKKIRLNTAIGTALLSSLAFTHFHPQWLVWLMPILILYSVRKNDFFTYLISILCWFGVLFSFDDTLHLKMFIHSRWSLPEYIRSLSIFKQLVQMCRAGLIAILISLYKK